MKKVKTVELIGAALDWAVAKCEGVTEEELGNYRHFLQEEYSPSTNWAHGGPIIEREGISLTCNLPMELRLSSKSYEGSWRAYYSKCASHSETFHGNNVLVISMRCYVTSKLGDEVEIPEGLYDCEKDQSSKT